ncbi:hypothetical protein ACPCSC_30425 [Streptomyces lavendulocolor]|uniref:hypothetical protein n=1 Tax=Streptomyces lavendulocolor TaxID=67316 RepID=UPI003C2B286A
MHTELLAQLIEEVSLLAADRRRKENRTITRPYASSPDSAVPTGNTGPAQQPAPVNGHRKMLAAAARRGMVRPHG